MRELTASLLKDCFTGIDGVSYDVGRVLLALAVLVYLALGVVMAIKANAEHPLDFQAFGIGFGSLVTGGGILLRLKQGTEPKAGDP